MDPRDVLHDKFKRVDSLNKSKILDERQTANSRGPGLALGLDLSRVLEESKGRRRSSFNMSTVHSASLNRRRGNQRSSQPPSLLSTLLERDENRAKVKQDLLKEWKKEDKQKFRFLSDGKLSPNPHKHQYDPC